MKKFERDLNNKVIAGVAGGIGKYFKVEPKFVRVVFLIATLFPPFFPSLVVYAIFCLLMPVSNLKRRKKGVEGGEVIDVEIN